MGISYLTHLGVIISIFIILGVSLNMALGYTGLLNLGHIAFYGIGAYTSAILTTHYGYSYLAALLSAAVLAGFAGLFLTLITGRLKGDYFALGTLGFSFVVYAIFLNWTELTGGSLGISGIPKPNIFGIEISSNFSYLIFTLIITTLICWFLYKLAHSRYGKLLEAIRDDEVGLQSLGKNTSKMKYQIMALSAALAGIAGSLYAHYITFIDPSTFYLNSIIIIVTIVIVGGLASIRGSIAAAIIILLLPELLRFLNLPSDVVGPGRQIIYSIVLLLILLYRPRGLFGKVDI